MFQAWLYELSPMTAGMLASLIIRADAIGNGIVYGMKRLSWPSLSAEDLVVPGTST